MLDSFEFQNVHRMVLPRLRCSQPPMATELWQLQHDPLFALIPSGWIGMGDACLGNGALNAQQRQSCGSCGVRLAAAGFLNALKPRVCPAV